MTYLQLDNRDNQVSPCAVYQEGFRRLECGKQPEIQVYAHDDVTVHEPHWKDELQTLFDNRNVVAVGLGGARSLGNWDLYRKPYDIHNMARHQFLSNLDDAETHGRREVGRERVAVLDAFFMAVRRSFLVGLGGWPIHHLTHHCLDLWLACEAAKAEKEIWMTGVSCCHLGGRSSTKGAYVEARWLQGGTIQSDHELPHRWLWDEYRGVLPIITNGH